MSDSNNMPPGASQALDRIHEAEDAAAAARDAVYKAVYRSMVDGLTAGDAARLVYTPGYTTCSYKSLRTVLDESGEHTAEIIGLLGRLARGEGEGEGSSSGFPSRGKMVGVQKNRRYYVAK